MTYNELINKFLATEKKLSFGKVNGLMYSQLRFFLFRKIQVKLLKTNNKNSRDINLSFKTLFLELLAILLFFIKLPFFLCTKNKILYAEHGRYINYKNELVDPYSFLSQKNDLKDNSLIRIGSIKNSYLDLKIFNFRYLFISVYNVYLLSYFFAFLLSPLILVFFISFYLVLKKNKFFNKYINLKLLIKFSLVYSRNILSIILIFIMKPKKIKVVDAYNFNSSFIIAGNILNIETFEFQHGMISNQHIGYNLKLDLFLKKIFLPKKIYLWSQGWAEFVPIIKDKISIPIPWTYEYFYEVYKKQEETIKDIDILIIGQPSIQKDIVKIVNHISSLFKGKRIYYKMHPKEIELNFNSNITIIKDELYALLLRSNVVIGGFSTVLLESKAMEINTVSLKSITPDEYLNVLDSFDIRLIDDEKQISEEVLFDNNNISINLPIDLNNRFGDLDE